MEEAIIFLVGFLLGGFITRAVVIRGAQNELRPYEKDPQYPPAVRAVTRHLKNHGTINLPQLEQMMSIRGVTAMRYLEQMKRQGYIKSNGHKGQGIFYTRP